MKASSNKRLDKILCIFRIPLKVFESSALIKDKIKLALPIRQSQF